GDAAVGGFVARPTLPSFTRLLSSARTNGVALARLVALLAGAIPFGETTDGSIVAYFLAEAPAKALVAAIEPDTFEVRLLHRNVAELALSACVRASNEDPSSLE